MAKYEIGASRELKPTDKAHLDAWLRNYTGVRLARKGVCEGHSAQLDVMAHLWFKQPADMLLLGARGSGKSFISSLHSHMRSRFFPGHGTRILGGAKSQAQQVLQGFNEAVLGGGSTRVIEGRRYHLDDRDSVEQSAVEFIRYRNGSEVRILTCSPTSVRGPHIPDLKLDEVDEIEPHLRDASYGMVMAKGKDRSIKPTILKTSTWHNLGGPMQDLVDKAKANPLYPFYTFCLFDVLERCPEHDEDGPCSGPPKAPGADGYSYENCHACPLRKYCYEDSDKFCGEPKAKRADGHYTIGSALQKLDGVPERTFAADYLCSGPKAEGLWFTGFDPKLNVSDEAEYDPSLPVEVALDTGLHTGAVFFQIKKTYFRGQPDYQINVFADYYIVDQIPEVHVNGLKQIAAERCQGRMEHRWTDPAGQQRNAIGSVALGEYQLHGMTFKCWPAKSVKDGLTLVEGLIADAAGKRRLLVHPRCFKTLQAFQCYRRASIRGQYMDAPEDPQHPAEDLIDSLRGGLIANFPSGRLPAPNFSRVPARMLI